MSRTKKHEVIGSRDLWGKRPLASEDKNSYNKKRCRKIERQQAKNELNKKGLEG